MEQGLVSIVGPYIWGYDDETPEQTVGQLLTHKNLTLATMESCTAGLLASSITEVSNSRRYFKGGVVFEGETISSAIARRIPALGEIIESYGIVSQEAAGAMAQASREMLKADIGIGVTGVAGPEEIEGNPVGLIHIAIALNETVRYFPSRWPPRRTVIKHRAVSTALIELRRLLNTT